MNPSKNVFAIVQFDGDDDAVEIIRTKWGFFNHENVLTDTYFPQTTNSNYFRDILKNNPTPDNTWTDNGELWTIKKFFRFTDTLEDAENKIEYYLNITDVSTDDNPTENPYVGSYIRSYIEY
ncbi:uncharacterized protein LOC122509716 [Leptopilina heterotoma]|uniref:uncharacterized protein LOC122509716 n=1 Tax=Leptopilina heterotoma TaxID=63436 RepID=UPI001CA865D2|nr:uncharacterized protein LOC122509716 [Leptopilina heterotoma]